MAIDFFSGIHQEFSDKVPTEKVETNKRIMKSTKATAVTMFFFFLFIMKDLQFYQLIELRK